MSKCRTVVLINRDGSSWLLVEGSLSPELVDYLCTFYRKVLKVRCFNTASVVLLAVAAFDDLDSRLAEIRRTEGVHERVQPGVYVRQPEHGRIQVAGNGVRFSQADVEYELERDPAHDVSDHDVR